MSLFSILRLSRVSIFNAIVLNFMSITIWDHFYKFYEYRDFSIFNAIVLNFMNITHDLIIFNVIVLNFTNNVI